MNTFMKFITGKVEKESRRERGRGREQEGGRGRERDSDRRAKKVPGGTDSDIALYSNSDISACGDM